MRSSVRRAGFVLVPVEVIPSRLEETSCQGWLEKLETDKEDVELEAHRPGKDLGKTFSPRL
jgi:hypothetical protein